jgi:hypothetical protein
MGNGAYSADYTAREVYVKHLKEAARRHDVLRYQWVGINNVPFDSNFNTFAGSVAYAIRALVIYRSDGGYYARGLVRASGELEGIHKAYMALQSRPRNGDPIRLAAALARRKDQDPTKRWMMGIKFRAPDFEFGDEIAVTVDPSVVNQGWKNVTEHMLEHAHSWIRSQHGDRASRVVGMLNIADRLGYPKNWDMFYYARPAVGLYVKWESAQPDEDRMGPRSKRGKMTTATGGKVPFDGDTGFPVHITWRIYPFRDAAKLCMGKDPDGCAATVSQQLKHHEEEMLATFRDIDAEINRVFSVPTSLNPFSMTGKSAASLGPLALAFLQHLEGLAKSQDSLYSVYPPPKSFWMDGGYHP